jgi:hypothetical protein
MSPHYFVVADRGHLRVFAERSAPGQSQPALDQLSAMDFPGGKESYTDRDTDMAGRFQGSKTQGAAPGSPTARTGMSIDERLPMKREAEKRRVEEIAKAIDAFFQPRSNAQWDLAAAPELNQAIVENLSPAVRGRLRRTLPKDLVNQSMENVRAQFLQK